MRKKEEAENLIREVYFRWITEEMKNNDAHGLIFYGFLSKNYPDLLNFRDQGDKYQTISVWTYQWRKLV